MTDLCVNKEKREPERTFSGSRGQATGWWPSGGGMTGLRNTFFYFPVVEAKNDNVQMKIRPFLGEKGCCKLDLGEW